ncbi:MAG TPA: NAD(P)/FAD-dependent oxidoreductase [Oceanipulchritudo sp.]|nr:NAD(P)/FAD-dependent oxidoreductase [Oceanipulchritudo sp.]
MALPEHDSYDAVIIGAGLSGLSAGIRLSQFFQRVLIVEGHTIPGGLNSYYERGKPRQLFSSGLHTVTNARVTGRKWGLGLIARNLGIKPEDFQLHEPVAPSRITTPHASVRFSNESGLLREEIARTFPDSIDEFSRFEELMVALTSDPQATAAKALGFLRGHFSRPELGDLLALPVFTYAGYAEGDIDLRTFALLYRSIFIDGCGSPVDMKGFLQQLVRKYSENGGELCYRAPVETILHRDGIVRGVRFKGGAEISARFVLSSAGLHETGQLAGMALGRPGRISLFQAASAYDVPLSSLGVSDTIHFLSRQERFIWSMDPESNPFDILTFSAQDQYAFPAKKHQFKASCFDRMANWEGLDKKAYREKKAVRAAELMRLAAEIYPGLGGAVPLLVDTFTPVTIRRYTSHPNGTLYGGELKAFDGRTPVKNLMVIGNDQGGIGIMGALTSGILVSNYSVLVS